MHNTLTRKEKAYFDAAKAISKLSDHRHKLGCIIVEGHHIIGSGHNSQSRKHPLQAQLDKNSFKMDDCQGPVHAEFAALLPFLQKNQNVAGATLYIYREHANGHTALSRPCSRCMQIIKRCGIKKIKYTSEDGYVYEKLIY